jgi:hypothetical protein
MGFEPSSGLPKEQVSVAYFSRKEGTMAWSAVGVQLRLIILVLPCFFLFAPAPAVAANVVLMESPNEHPSWREQAELACRFYGLEVKTWALADHENRQEIMWALGDPATVAVVADARALANLDRKIVLAALKRSARSVPLLIAGVQAGIDPGFVRAWSGNAVLGSLGPIEVSSSSSYRVGGVVEVARELAGQTLPFLGGNVTWLLLNQINEPDVIISIGDGNRTLPLLVWLRTGKQEVFVLAQCRMSQEAKRRDLSAVFPDLGPLLMFVRYAAGDMAWHAIRHYANLTVDDPWLTEPYGNLSYEGLLGEMQKHDFHTTIAFIPWNFDRSKVNVVSLIREHLDKYSICIHGDNHDHQEFYNYTKEPLSRQRQAIEQALARMERFESLTGLPYDRVMVWPHEVVPPVPTLAILKQYNFLANLDADVVPLGSKLPNDPFLALRAEQVSFANFLTIRRMPLGFPISTDGPWRSIIAENEFLENPVLFYVHQDFFHHGIGAFNGIADTVNDIQPPTVWAGLGEIVRHLYLERRRKDGNYDVWTFSSQIELENPDSRVATFFVEKEESSAPALKSLTVAGESIPYRQMGNVLSFHTMIPPKESRNVLITYSNDLQLAAVEVSKSPMRVSALRRLSDFRDLWLTKNRVGAAFVSFYYRYASSKEPYIEELFGSGVFWTLIVLIVLSVGWWRFRPTTKARRVSYTPGSARAVQVKDSCRLEALGNRDREET